MTVYKAAAYELLPRVDTDVRDKLLSEDTPNDMVDVVQALVNSELPLWLFHYLEEVETPANLGGGLVALLDDEVINETAARYADAGDPIIDLTSPTSQDWTQKDLLKASRDRFEAKQEAIQTAVRDAYTEAFAADVPQFTDEAFVEWFGEGVLEELNLLDWAVYEHRARSLGAEDAESQVAEWFVERTGGMDLESVVAHYQTEGADYEAYSEVEVDLDIGRPAVSLSDEDADNPITRPTLPTRDVDITKAAEEVDVEELMSGEF